MDVSRICSHLVAINSENPPGRTVEVIEYIRTLLDGLGIHSTVTKNPGGRYNLVTTDNNRRLLFLGHVDVVPARDEGWTYPPQSGRVADGYVWGRGATDMKGGCAALLAACDALVSRDTEIPATLSFVCDEETGGEYGVRHLIAEHLIIPCDCVIVEPTPTHHPCIGQKGLCRLEMKFTGTPVHGSLYPAVGVSAVMEAMSLLEYVKGLHGKDYPVDDKIRKIIARSSSVLGEEFKIKGISNVLKQLMFNPGIISGGEKSNIVAQHCDLDLEIRVPWGCSIPELVAGITAHAPHGKIVSETTHDPSLTDPACPLVGITCREVEKVYGGNVFPIVQWAASDARHLRCAGFRVIEYGPGEIPTLHAVNERVSVSSLNNATVIYQGIMQHYSPPEK